MSLAQKVGLPTEWIITFKRGDVVDQRKKIAVRSSTLKSWAQNTFGDVVILEVVRKSRFQELSRYTHLQPL